MITASIQSNLDKARNGIINDSYDIQKTIGLEDVINEVLEKINEVRGRFLDMSKNVLSIVESLEKLSWIAENPSEEILREINAILDISRGVHAKLNRHRSDLQKTPIVKICPEATQIFFDDIDLLEETIDDIEAIYFRLPHNQDFKEICKKLSSFK